MAIAELLQQHNLTEGEYDQIVQILGREPNLTELGIFSVMWSEHCSYKSSRIYLKRLPTRGPHVIQGPGENAGVVDLGDGLAAVFKIESHNHPSFIEPYQGAATGVGGIIRDIFTMGARPIALMNSLHFGMPYSSGKVAPTRIRGEKQSQHIQVSDSSTGEFRARNPELKTLKPKSDTRHATSETQFSSNQMILEGVVAGIAGYGNCIGIPTVGGEVFFHPCYDSNPLVNVFCLGVACKDRIFYGRATGPGNSVIYVGAKTGRDGIHGATMASAEFDEDSKKKRPTVQVGDPFLEKLLLEACLEAMESGAILGIQDMGAAGLTCSTCEMGGRAGTGIEIDLALVPQRERGMIPYEIMLSESQERMLLVCEKGREERVLGMFQKWDLDAVVIGKVTSNGILTVTDRGNIVACIPNDALTEKAPVYARPAREPEYLRTAPLLETDQIPEPVDYNDLILNFISTPNMCSRRWIFRQYDHMVRTNTCVLPGHDAAVIRLKESETLALAMTLDGNPRYCYFSPRQGALLAVAESCRNLACVGATPLGATNCLNFASPENPEVMWQFIETIEGIKQGCEYFDAPITGGNVSFYNETMGRGVYPTPVLGMVGVLDRQQVVTASLKNEGDVLLLLGDTRPELGASEYVSYVMQQDLGPTPEIDLAAEKRLHDLLRTLAKQRLLQSAHDCSEGGLIMTLLEKSFLSGSLGWKLSFDTNLRADLFLFGESPSRAVVSCQKTALEQVVGEAQFAGVPCQQIGEVVPETLKLSLQRKLRFDTNLATARAAWLDALENVFKT
ncbi:MAG: phosphoribosylformylglycinamidine synthase subunit PurL [Acidobacteria bacterium]|nr:phosphoribosylformylglycinamidine synthase subunit PurL [Acidobacteriota bacterium]